MQNILVQQARSLLLAFAPTPTSPKNQDTFRQQIPSILCHAGAASAFRTATRVRSCDLSQASNPHSHRRVDARPASPPGYSPELVDREPPVNFCTQTGPTSTPPTFQPFDSAAVSRRERSNADPKVRIDRIPPFRGCRCNKLLPVTPTLRPLAWWIYPLGLNPSIPCRQLNALQRLESAALQPRGSRPPFGIEQPDGLAPALGIRPQLPRERTQRTEFPGYRPPRKHHPVQAVTCSCPGRIEPCIGPESPRFLCTCPTPFLLVAENALIRAP
jgi:hypothetical protein